MTRLARAALLSALLLLGGAGAAQASSVSATSSCDVGSKDPRLFCVVSVDYVAAPGERNSVIIAEGAGAVVEDHGAPLSAADGCVQDGPHRALCAFDSEQPPDVLWLEGSVGAGDRDDEVHVPADGSRFEVDGGRGDDRLRGGAVTYADRTAPVEVDLRAGAGGQAGEHDVLIDIDGVTGGSGDDLIVSDRRSELPCFDADLGQGNRIRGGPGADRIVGAAGSDCVMGDADDDRITGGAGGDWLDGGPGADRVTGGRGTNTLYGGLGRDRLTGPAGFADGGGGADRITGGSGYDELWGGTGMDRIDGAGGGDNLLGEEGDDRLTGGSGRDVLAGGPGDDRLDGHDGARDRLYGGAGSDSASADAGDRLRSVERRP